MQDLKTGHLLRASPRSQFYGQMIGSLASVFVSTAGYKFYTSVYEIPGPQFAVPSAGVWYVFLSLSRQLALSRCNRATHMSALCLCSG
jgi:uncharacterized oligopeptide transporter (OPT) family protein